MKDRMINRKHGDQKRRLDTEDLLTLFADIDAHKIPIPVFVAANLQRIPPFASDATDFCSLAFNVNQMQSQMASLEKQVGLYSDVIRAFRLILWQSRRQYHQMQVQRQMNRNLVITMQLCQHGPLLQLNLRIKLRCINVPTLFLNVKTTSSKLRRAYGACYRGNFSTMLRKKVRYPCTVCERACGVDTTECSSCAAWSHRKCVQMSDSDFRVFAADDFVYLCPRCLGRRDDGSFDWDVPLQRSVYERPLRKNVNHMI